MQNTDLIIFASTCSCWQHYHVTFSHQMSWSNWLIKKIQRHMINNVKRNSFYNSKGTVFNPIYLFILYITNKNKFKTEKTFIQFYQCINCQHILIPSPITINPFSSLIIWKKSNLSPPMTTIKLASAPPSMTPVTISYCRTSRMMYWFFGGILSYISEQFWRCLVMYFPSCSTLYFRPYIFWERLPISF